MSERIGVRFVLLVVTAAMFLLPAWAAWSYTRGLESEALSACQLIEVGNGEIAPVDTDLASRPRMDPSRPANGASGSVLRWESGCSGWLHSQSSSRYEDVSSDGGLPRTWRDAQDWTYAQSEG